MKGDRKLVCPPGSPVQWEVVAGGDQSKPQSMKRLSTQPSQSALRRKTMRRLVDNRAPDEK